MFFFLEYMNIIVENSHQIVNFLESVFFTVAKRLRHFSPSFLISLSIQGEDGEIGPRGLAGESVRLFWDLIGCKLKHIIMIIVIINIKR